MGGSNGGEVGRDRSGSTGPLESVVSFFTLASSRQSLGAAPMPESGRFMPHPTSILETVLYADDLSAMAAFYTQVIGLELIGESDSLSIALRVSPGAVLLVFDPGLSAVPGRTVPSHGYLGPGHLAFSIEPDSLASWRDHLKARSVPIEQEIDWPARPGRKPGHSIYIRDPAGHSVELITADIWPDSTRSPGG